MHLIVVTDIFGQTPELENLISEVIYDNHIVQIISPYEKSNMDFGSEDDAYKYFQNICGLGKLSELVENTISNSRTGTILIGFSVGASSIWKISTCKYAYKISKSVCFYGSRIRNMVDINPKFKTNLIFPKIETHFSIDKLLLAVERKDNVVFEKTKYLHGFMNKRSVNYDEAGYNKYIDYLKLQLT